MKKTDEQDGCAAFATALERAQQACKPVDKDSTNAFHKYRYASAEDIVTEARSALRFSGLTVFTYASTIETVKADGAEVRLNLKRRVVLMHSETGYREEFFLDWPLVPEKGRPLDKAAASAATTSLAYFLRDLLLMPRVDESDDMDHPSRDKAREKAGRKDSADLRLKARAEVKKIRDPGTRARAETFLNEAWEDDDLVRAALARIQKRVAEQGPAPEVPGAVMAAMGVPPGHDLGPDEDAEPIADEATGELAGWRHKSSTGGVSNAPGECIGTPGAENAPTGGDTGTSKIGSSVTPPVQSTPVPQGVAGSSVSPESPPPTSPSPPAIDLGGPVGARVKAKRGGGA